LDDRVPKFIGQHLWKGQRELLVCEGQDDAIASDYMLNEGRPASMQTLCVSVPSGANLKAFKDNYDFITESNFSRVTFCPDNDDAGQKVVEQVASLFPKIRIMTISEKDACDMLKEKKQPEFKHNYVQAKKYKPPSIVDISKIVEKLDEFVPMGLSYPWENLTRVTYGMVAHQIVSVGSGPGAGKSSVVRAIQQHLMFHHELPIGNFALEDNTETALRYLIGYMINQRIHIPGSVYDKALVRSTAMSLVDKAYFFDNRYFKGEFKMIEQTIRFLHANGVNHFFIDPISALSAHLSASDANTFINSIMIDMSRLIQELPVYIMLVNHLNNPTSGKAHDEGGRVLPSQMTGSKSQWRYSTDMWGFERDLLNEDPEVKNTMTVRNLKHRSDGSKTGSTCQLHYNVDTGRLEERNVSSMFAPSVTPKAAPLAPVMPNNKPKSFPTKSLGDLMGD
jgi:twinkle protein